MQGGYIQPQKVPSGLVLAPDEVVLWYGRRSWKSFLGHFILGTLLLFAFGMGLLIFLYVALARLSAEYAITNRRIYARAGILRKTNLDTPLDKVTETGLSQGIIARILGYGNVFINTSGGGGLPIAGRGVLPTVVGKFVFVGVDRPEHVRAMINNLKEQYKVRERATERLERLEDQLLTSQITQQQYENARRQILANLPGVAAINPPPPSPGIGIPPANPPPVTRPTSMQGTGLGKGIATPQRFCIKCGAPLVPGTAFCGSCGVRI